MSTLAMLPAAVPSDLKHGRSPYLGMIVALISWAMLFAAFFLAYAVLRVQQPTWPPPGSPPLPTALAAFNTAVLLASSLALWRGTAALARGRQEAFPRWLAVSILLGAAFLGLQVLLWQTTEARGIHLGGLLGSIFYVLTILHAIHMAAGVGALLWLVPRTRRGEFTAARHVPVTLVAMFWHFMDLMWVAMFVGIFLL
jgi:cytochrome c oxidase subunit 3